MLDDGLPTDTSREQWALESKVTELYSDLDTLLMDGNQSALILQKSKHAAFLKRGLGHLHKGFASLDASRVWICYWIVHGLKLLGEPLEDPADREAVIAFIATCQQETGGFGGGPYQLAHLAPTYAAVATLVTLGGADALGTIDRGALMGFFLRMAVTPRSDGGMIMHEGGEVDIRGCYCAVAVCHMLALDPEPLVQRCGMIDFIQRCQTYEGGLGGEPGNEAHGGYSFCGLAALSLLGAMDALDLPALLDWVSSLQAPLEGGFAGRTNKLVDGCYSFWQGAMVPLIGEAGLLPPATQHFDAENDDATSESQRLSPAEIQAKTWVDTLARQLEAAEAQETEAEEAYEKAVETGKSAEPSAEHSLPALQHRARDAGRKAQRLREALDRARSHAATLPFAARTLGLDASTKEGWPDANIADRQTGGCDLPSAAALQVWLLVACQERGGGLRDKPGKSRDFYHTCYCLSGLAASQAWSGLCLGGEGNAMPRIHLACNVEAKALAAAQAWAAGR